MQQKTITYEQHTDVYEKPFFSGFVASIKIGSCENNVLLWSVGQFPHILCIHTYTCMYKHIYIHIYAYIHIHLYVCMRVYYVCMYTYMYKYAKIYQYMTVYKCMCTHEYMYVCVYTFVHTSMYICMHVCLHVCIYVIFKFGFERYRGNCPSWEGELSGELSILRFYGN